MNKRWLKFVVLAVIQYAMAVGFCLLTSYCCNNMPRGVSRLFTALALPLLALPAFVAAAAFGAWKPGHILIHLIFLLLILPGIFLAQTGFWKIYSYYDYFRYAQRTATEEVEARTLCLIIAAVACYILLIAYTIRSDVKKYKLILLSRH